MKIKDIISHGKAYNKVINYEFEINKNLTITLNDLILSIDNIKDTLKDSEDDYNNILYLMLNDKYLLEGIINNYNNGQNIYDSVHNTIDVYRHALLGANHDYLNQRVVDLDNLEYIILSGVNKYNYDRLTEDVIVITKEIIPSFLIDNLKHIKGIVSLKGGNLSHTAILARGHGIPYILVDDFDFDYNTKYYIDTTKNLISNDCGIDITLNDSNDNILELTKDSNIKIYANVFNNDDLNKVIKHNFMGIGLYRTEFIFMNHDKPMPLAIEQSVYEEALRLLHPKTIVFRTFDVGDDKNVSYLKTTNKSVMNYLNNLDIFKSQIKALLKANIYGNVSIMFPMIRTIDEYRILKNIVVDIATQTNTTVPPLGIMLETKEALYNLNDFKEVPFISLGTNDLTKELYNIDRDNINRLELYFNDLILHIKNVVNFCNKNKIKLSICGELGSYEPAIKGLIDAGITNFSVSPACFEPIIKQINHKK